METKSNKRVSPVGGTCRIFARSVRDAAANKHIKVPCTDSPSSISNENSYTVNNDDVKESHVKVKNSIGRNPPRSLFSPNDIMGLGATSHDCTDNLNKKKTENDVNTQTQENELKIDQTLKDILNDQSKSDFAKAQKSNKDSKIIGHNSSKNISRVSLTSVKSESRKLDNQCSTNNYHSKVWKRKQIYENIENSKPRRQRPSAKSNQKDVNRITNRISHKRQYKRILGRGLSTETQVEDWNSELIDITAFDQTALNDSQSIYSPSKGIKKSNSANVINTRNTDSNRPEIWIKKLIIDIVYKINPQNSELDLKTNDIDIKPHIKPASLQQPLNTDQDIKVCNDSMYETTSINCIEATDSDGIVYLQEGEMSGTKTRRPVFSRGGIKPLGVTRGGSTKGKRCLSSIEDQNKSAVMASRFMESFRKLQNQNKNNIEELNKSPTSISVDSSKTSLEGNVHARFSQDYRKSQLYKPTEDTENKKYAHILEGKNKAHLPCVSKVKHSEKRHLKEEKRVFDNCKDVSRIAKQKIILLQTETQQTKIDNSVDTRQTDDRKKPSSSPTQHKKSKKKVPYFANHSGVEEIEKLKCRNDFKGGAGEPAVGKEEIQTLPNREEYRRCYTTDSIPGVHSLTDITYYDMLEEDLKKEKHSPKNSAHVLNSNTSLTGFRTRPSSTELPSRSKSMQQIEGKISKPADHSEPTGCYNNSRHPAQQPSPLYPNTNWMHCYPYGYMYPTYYSYDYDPKYMTNNMPYGWSSEEMSQRFNQEDKQMKNKTKDPTGKKSEEICVEETNRNTQMTRENIKKDLCHLITIPLREIQDEKQVKNLLEYVNNVLKGIANSTGCYYQADVDGNIPVLHLGATLKEKHSLPPPPYNPADGFNIDGDGQFGTSVNGELKNMSSVKSLNSSIVSYDLTDEEESCDEELKKLQHCTKNTAHDTDQMVIALSEDEGRHRIVKEFPEISQDSTCQSTEEMPELSKTNQAVPSSAYQHRYESGKYKTPESELGKLAENEISPVLTVERDKELNKIIDSKNDRYVPPHKRKYSEDKHFSKITQVNDLYCWQNWENNNHSQPIWTKECGLKNSNRNSFPEEKRNLLSHVSVTGQNNTFFYRGYGYGREKQRSSEATTNSCSSYSGYMHQDIRPFSYQNKISKESSDIWKRYLHQRCTSYKTKFIDTHCHLDFLFNRLEYHGSFKKFKEINSDCFPSNYEGCISIFCDPKTFDLDGLWKDLVEEDEVWIGMGCHPKHAKEFDQFSEDNMKKIITHPKVIALGEIGLDYSSFHGKYKALQKTVFKRQLKLGLEVKKPLIIHCRDAEDDCLEIMEQMVPINHKIHCHCFTGNYMQAERWLNMFPNLYLGLTPLVTYSSATASHDFARNVPLSRLILETDSPYFVPRNLKKEEQKFSFPGFAIVVAEEVARLKATSVENVLVASRQNTKNLFNI